MQGDVAVQLDAEAGRVGNLQLAVHGNGFADQLRMEHGHDLVGAGGHHQELRERAVMARHDEVVGIDG
ncbi:hypothetical protein D3C86_1715960 [compost metagenome]